MQSQEPSIKPSAPYGAGDQPPPYSEVMGQNPNSGYPQMGFIPPVNTAPPNTYPHPVPPQTAPPSTYTPGAYPHPVPPHVAPPNTHPPPGAYPQAASAYPQQQRVILGATQTQVPVNVVLTYPMGTDSVSTYCTSCNQQVMSKVTYTTSWHTHLIAGIICFSTMFFSMCCLGLVPYCLDSCKNAEHYCPNCNAYLGKYQRC